MPKTENILGEASAHEGTNYQWKCNAQCPYFTENAVSAGKIVIVFHGLGRAEASLTKPCKMINCRAG
jgi:hypothetical protein